MKNLILGSLYSRVPNFNLINNPNKNYANSWERVYGDTEERTSIISAKGNKILLKGLFEK